MLGLELDFLGIGRFISYKTARSPAGFEKFEADHQPAPASIRAIADFSLTMIFTTLLAATALISGASAAPGLEKRQSTPNGEGTHDGYFYS